MGILDKITNMMDSFKSADFEIAGNMKVNSVCEAFKKNFGLTLRIYRGSKLIDGRMTINTLDERTTTTTINKDAERLTIKANQTVGEVEKLFLDHFGLKVRIATYDNSKFCPASQTLGEARRTK